VNRPRLLITSGPTREYLDPVRYLSNGSSGQMGRCLAVAALKNGFDVTIRINRISCKSNDRESRFDSRDVRRRDETLARVHWPDRRCSAKRLSTGNILDIENQKVRQ